MIHVDSPPGCEAVAAVDISKALDRKGEDNSRIDLATDNGLQPHDSASSHHHRIHKPMRHRSVPATPVQSHPHAISSTHKQTPPRANNPSPMRHNMGSENNIRDRNTMALRIIKAIVYHRLRARPALLSRLENQHQSPRPLLASGNQGLGGSQQAGNVHVVAAGVHDGLVDAVGISHAFLAGVREAGALFDREGVEIGSQEDRGAFVAVAQDGRDAVAAYAGFDVEVAGDGAELRDAAGGGFFFLVGEFRVGVEVLVEVFVFVELWAVFGGDFGDVGHVGGFEYFYKCMGGCLQMLWTILACSDRSCKSAEGTCLGDYLFYLARRKDDSKIPTR